MRPRARTIAAIIVFLLDVAILFVEHIWPRTNSSFTWIDLAAHSLFFGVAGFLAYPEEVLPLIKIVIEKLPFSNISFSRQEKISPAEIKEAKVVAAEAVLSDKHIDVVEAPAVVIADGKVVVPPKPEGGGE